MEGLEGIDIGRGDVASQARHRAEIAVGSGNQLLPGALERLHEADELIGIERPFTAEDVAMLDGALSMPSTSRVAN